MGPGMSAPSPPCPKVPPVPGRFRGTPAPFPQATQRFREDLEKNMTLPGSDRLG